jgi:hypothetical protein
MLQWEATCSVSRMYSVVTLADCGGQKRLSLYVILYFNV